MSWQEINIVWLKRDLRTRDHAFLCSAEKGQLPPCGLTGKRGQDPKKIWGHRREPLVQQENSRILATHTRRHT